MTQKPKYPKEPKTKPTKPKNNGGVSFSLGARAHDKRGNLVWQ